MADSDNTNTCMGFVLKERLGYGGFSWTHRAVRGDGTEAALKFTPVSCGNPRQQDRQDEEKKTELQVLNNINHPNIVNLIDFTEHFDYTHVENNTTRDTFVFALELCGNGEMFDLIYYTGKFDERLARTFFRQILLGLQAMHDAGFAHRDIKPQNVLLDANFQVKLADFGSSKAFTENNLMRTTRVGTRGYQAPELLLGRGYTRKADLFSCGVLLFVSLTKHPPFKQAQADDQWFRQIAKRQFGRFWGKHPRDKAVLSDAVKDLFVNLCCYQPLDRIDCAGALAHPWMQEEIIPPEAMVEHCIEMRREAKEARGKDKARNPDTWQSVNQRGPKIVPPTIPTTRRFYAYHTESHPNQLLKRLQMHFEEDYECDLREAECLLEITCDVQTDQDTLDHDGEIKVLIRGYKEGPQMPENYNHETQTGDFFIDIPMKGFSPAQQDLYELVMEELQFECLPEDMEDSEEEVEVQEEDSDGQDPDELRVEA